VTLRILVCVKRVPAPGTRINVTADGQAVDTTHLGFTTSPHEECAVEAAVHLVEANGGEATVLTLGGEESLEQVRDALAVGCSAAVRIDADADRFGPADVAAAVADVVRQQEAGGTGYDLILLGNDAADTGDFQVGVRLAYALGRPVVTGIGSLEVSGATVTARGDGPAGTEVFELDLPAVITVLEGGVSPRYPSIPGRMKAKRAPVETVAPAREPVGGGRVRLKLPPAQPSQVEILGQGADAAPAVVDLLQQLGVVSR